MRNINENMWVLDSSIHPVVASNMMRQGVEKVEEALRTLDRLIRKERLTKEELEQLLEARHTAKYAKVMGL